MIIKSRHILNYIISTGDSDILALLMPYKEKLFLEIEELEVFEILEGVFNTQHIVPTPGLLKNYALSKKAKELVKTCELSEDIKDSKSATLAVNSLLFQTFIDFISVDARTGLQDLLTTNITDFEEKSQDYIQDIASALSFSKLKHTRESLIFGEDYINKSRARYAKTKVSGNYIVCKYGYKNLDDKLGGIANNDFINILAYVKQFKSTLLRNIMANAVLQGKNCLLITLEMSDEEVEAELQAIHSSNKVRFGPGKPHISPTAIKEGSLSDEAEDFLFNEIIPDLANSDDLGIVKIINPSEGEYYFSDLISDINRTRATMDIDIVLLDYLTLAKPGKRYTRDDVNDMFKAVRKYGLTNRIPFINCVQVGRAAYNDMLEDEFHRYKPDSASDYNEVERSSTVMLSTAQTPEMKSSNEIYVSCILSRRSNVDSLPFKTIYSNGKMVEISPSDTLDEDTTEVLSHISID
jgi:hypothetical protein